MESTLYLQRHLASHFVSQFISRSSPCSRASFGIGPASLSDRLGKLYKLAELGSETVQRTDEKYPSLPLHLHINYSSVTSKNISPCLGCYRKSKVEVPGRTAPTSVIRERGPQILRCPARSYSSASSDVVWRRRAHQSERAIDAESVESK